MNYSERLKDPRWQRKRLEILQRSDFSCEECGDTTKTLHVHHKIYRKGAQPWEYENHELQSLCVGCHEAASDLRKRLDSALALLDLSELERAVGYVTTLAMFFGGGPKQTTLLACDRESGNLALIPGIADCLFGDLPGDAMRLIEVADKDGHIERRSMVELRDSRMAELGLTKSTGDL